MKKLIILILAIVISFVVYKRHRWNYIIIHHSASSYGNIEFLQKIHDQRQSGDPLKGTIAYHYAIGNGNGMEDGEIASDRRKQYDLPGVHLSFVNWKRNLRGLGICLIGNIDKKPMTPKQYESLVKHTKELMKKYNIEIENVEFHGKISGEQTRCPGKFFPYEKFIRDLKKR